MYPCYNDSLFIPIRASFFLMGNFRCSFVSLFSYFFVNFWLSYLSPSEVISKSLIPKSIPIKRPVDSIGTCSVSTKIDTKYLPEGT